MNLLVRARLGAVLLCIGGTLSGHAQWIGAGAGGSGTDFNDLTNWTGGTTITGDFSGITSSTSLQFDGGTTTSLSGLTLDYTGTGINTTLGTGTLASGTSPATINLSGDINFSGTKGNVTTLGGVNAGLTGGSDLIINLGTTASHNIEYGTTNTNGTGNPSLLVLNAQLTGGSTSKTVVVNYPNGVASVVFANDQSSFVASALQASGMVYYTSIANTGTASSVGTAGQITLTNGGTFAYIGSGNMTTNRTVQANVSNGNGILANFSSAANTTLTFTTSMSMTGVTSGGKVVLEASTGNTLAFAGNVTSVAALWIGSYGGSVTPPTSTGSFTTATTNGTVVLTGNNTYSGGTLLYASTLDINSATALGTGTITYNAVNAGSGSIILDNTSGAAITLTNNNAQAWNNNFTFTGTNDLNMGTGAIAMGSSVTRTVTVNGGTLTLGGVISGTTSKLTKAGAGTLLLGAANTYTGATTVNAGTLRVDGSLASTSAVTVAANSTVNATLAGNGTISGATTVGGGTGAGLSILNAGGVGAVGTLNTAGVSFSTTSELSFELNSTAGTIDLLNVTGTLALGSGTTLLSGTDLGSSVLTAGTVLTLAHASTALTGTFAGLTNGSDLAVGGNLFQINYTSTDVTLTEVAAVPEPTAWMLFGFGSLLLAWNWKRRVAAVA